MTSELVAALLAAAPAPVGSLQLHGEWFGRPFDNSHVVAGAVDLPGGAVEISFEDPTERLVVHEPRGIEIVPGSFTIRTVTALTWSWTWYGREDVPANRASITHEVHPGWVTVTASGPDGTSRRRLLRRGHLAVALLGFRPETMRP